MDRGGSRMWSVAGVGSGSSSMASSGVEVRSAMDDLSCPTGHSGLEWRVLSGACREMTTGDGTCVGESELMIASFLMTHTVWEYSHSPLHTQLLSQPEYFLVPIRSFFYCSENKQTHFRVPLWFGKFRILCSYSISNKFPPF